MKKNKTKRWLYVASMFILVNIVIGYFAFADTSDRTRPTSPKNLKTVTVNATNVQLSWTASTDNVAVDSYNVYRNGKRIAKGVTNLTYSDSGVVASRAYYYVVKAVDGSKNISFSIELCIDWAQSLSHIINFYFTMLFLYHLTSVSMLLN